MGGHVFLIPTSQKDINFAHFPDLNPFMSPTPTSLSFNFKFSKCFRIFFIPPSFFTSFPPPACVVLSLCLSVSLYVSLSLSFLPSLSLLFSSSVYSSVPSILVLPCFLPFASPLFLSSFLFHSLLPPCLFLFARPFFFFFLVSYLLSVILLFPSLFPLLLPCFLRSLCPPFLFFPLSCLVSSLASSSLVWSVLVCSSLFGFVLVYSGSSLFWFVLVCSGLFGLFMSVLVNSGLFWSILVYFGLFWSGLL